MSRGHRHTFASGPWGDWPLTLVFADVEGRLEWVGIEAERPLTSGVLRAPLREFVAEARRRYFEAHTKIAKARGYVGSQDLVSPRLVERAKRALDVTEPRPGRPPIYGPEHYEEVGQVYADAYRRHEKPRIAVANRWHVEPTTATKWIARARELGFLGQTDKGRAGGVPAQRRRKR